MFHEFERCNSRLHDWTESTFKKYHTLRNNLIEMRDYKRKAGLKFFDFTFEYFDEYGLQDYIDFLRNNKNYMNSSVTKNLSLIKVVIRWAYRRGFHNNNKFETFKPKMKTTQKKVVFSQRQSWIRLRMPTYQKPSSIFIASVMSSCSNAIPVYAIRMLPILSAVMYTMTSLRSRPSRHVTV